MKGNNHRKHNRSKSRHRKPGKGKKGRQSDNPFWQTVFEIRKMSTLFISPPHYEASSLKERQKIDKRKRFNLNLKKEKMPITHLKGIRKKKIQKYKTDIQLKRSGKKAYSSKNSLEGLDFYFDKLKNKKLKRQREHHDYKFREARNRRKNKAKFKNGTLKLSKREIQRIQRM